MSDHKYTDDGRKVLVVGPLNAEQTIVQEIYVSGNQEIPSGSNFVVSNLHDEPVESWKDRRIRETEERYESRMKSMEREYEAAQKRLSEAKEKAKLRADALLDFARNSDDVQLQRLYDFAAGNITHFFIDAFSRPQIATWEDDILFQMDSGMGRRKIEELKLVTLAGRTKGSLDFRLSQYSDGSGGMHNEITPCRSYEEALDEAQAALDHKAAEYVAGHARNLDLSKWEDIQGIRIPAAAAKMQEQQKEKNRQEKIRKLEGELAELRGESGDDA